MCFWPGSHSTTRTISGFSNVNHNVPTLGGTDYLVKIDKAILTANPSDIAGLPFTFYPVPSEDTMMHRIIRGPDGNMWFTEMGTDKVGRLSLVG
jgi:virginiamycin B lyase